MFNLILYEPEIPPNTGNIMRLCANTGMKLHLIKPLGFDLHEKKLRRAGLDYRDFVDVEVYENLIDCIHKKDLKRIFALTTKGTKKYSDIVYIAGDSFLLGPETRGLPNKVLELFDPKLHLRLPMANQSRSLNLSNVAAVIVYEAWRQNDFFQGI